MTNPLYAGPYVQPIKRLVYCRFDPLYSDTQSGNLFYRFKAGLRNNLRRKVHSFPADFWSFNNRGRCAGIPA